jgi:hypothetical protein
MALALRLADQARVGAQLASARAEVAEARLVNDEMIKNIAALKADNQRNMGAK